jgi:hypothetical protein
MSQCDIEWRNIIDRHGFRLKRRAQRADFRATGSGPTGYRFSTLQSKTRDKWC